MDLFTVRTEYQFHGDEHLFTVLSYNHRLTVMYDECHPCDTVRVIPRSISGVKGGGAPLFGFTIDAPIQRNLIFTTHTWLHI